MVTGFEVIAMGVFAMLMARRSRRITAERTEVPWFSAQISNPTLDEWKRRNKSANTAGFVMAALFIGLGIGKIITTIVR
ncbi:MAG: hypothetical protein JWN62_4121 [Acidimicrobiales bacterium]|nr:hypothetical protein [Acidimicrobiales bacterium]